MKKNVFYVAALLAGVLSSCSQAENLSLENEEPEQFVAVLAEGETRTMLGGDDGKSVLWKEGDALAIFRKNAYNYKYITSENGTNSATFKYADVFTPGADGVTGIDQYYAVYPYGEGITINNDKVVNVKIYKDQTYYENTFDPTAAFMFAASTDTKLPFQNAHALLKIVLNSMPGDTYTIKSITLTSESNALSGDATIRMDDDNKPLLQILNSGTLTEANNKLTLNCGEGVTIKGRTTNVDEDQGQEVPFYLVVTPGTYALELSINYEGIEKPDVVRIAYQENPLTIGRNEIWTIKYTCGNDEFTGEITGFDTTEQDVNNE